LSEPGEEVADLLLAGVDDLAVGGLVDGIRHASQEFLELAPHRRDELITRHLRQAVHDASLPCGQSLLDIKHLPVSVYKTRNVCQKDLPHPPRESLERLLDELPKAP
jgi:hypothetical protein